MGKLIDKDALVAEIKRLIKHSEMVADHNAQITELVSRELDALYHLISFINTLEVKEANEALRTEYEKGRHDVIEKTLKWLWDLNQEHEIMSYADSHVLGSEELQQYYKNNIEL